MNLHVYIYNVIRLAGLVKAHGVHLKGAGAMLRLRLYQGLLPLSGNAYESEYYNLWSFVINHHAVIISHYPFTH